MTTIEIVPLPGDPDAYRFALVVEQDGATELQVALWKQFGEECGAASTVVGETPIVVIDRTRELPALLAPIVAPGPCPSILNISPFTSGPICCELLATHLGRHTDGTTIWGEVEPYETPTGTVGIIDRGAGLVAQTSGIGKIDLADAGATNPEANQYMSLFREGGLLTGKQTPGGLLVEQLSADVNDDPPVKVEEHTHVWEIHNGDQWTTAHPGSSLYGCTHIWEAGDRCDALFYATSGWGPPQDQPCRRINYPGGSSKTQTLTDPGCGL